MKGTALPLPSAPLSGMYNKYGGKTRLTFKLDSDELWIGTKERTQKVKIGSIKDVVSQSIEGHKIVNPLLPSVTLCVKSRHHTGLRCRKQAHEGHG